MYQHIHGLYNYLNRICLFFVLLWFWYHFVFVVSQVLKHTHMQSHFYYTHNRYVCYILQ